MRGTLGKLYPLLAVWVVIAVVSAAIAPVVRADARTDARRHFTRGMALIAERQIPLGIAELRRAYEILPHPNVLYNIGVGYAEIGSWEQAAEAFSGYVESDPPDRVEVEAIVRDLRARIESEQAEVEPPPRETPDAPPPIEVETADLEALEESALQMETLAEVTESTQSPELRARAERLRTIASELRMLERGGPGEVEPPPGEREGPRQPPPGTPRIGARREQVYEEVVVSASRATESPIDAPNSLGIVTAQDIRLSGQNNLPEILRRVPGVEVFQGAPYGSQLSVRGFNDGVNPRILVLLNGRSVYWDFLGSTQWQAIPLTLETIERVEVIRGPASALYGADAFTGIVNILTHDPGEGGSFIRAEAGNGGELRGALSVSDLVDRFGYRFSAGIESADAFRQPLEGDRLDYDAYLDAPGKSHQRIWADTDLRYHIGEGYYVRAGGGVTAAEVSSLVGRGDIRFGHAQDLVNSQIHASLTTPFGVGVRAFWNRLSTEFDVPQISQSDIRNPIVIDHQDVVDVEAELSRSFELLVPQQLILGVNYRFKSVDWDWLGPERNENHFGAFIQDTLDIVSWLDLVGSFRVDFHPLIDEPLLSPRGSLIVHPTERSGVRFSAATAFRSPTFIESYFSLDTPTPLRGVFASGQGSLTLNPERIVAFELGYLSEDSEYFTLEANGYVNFVTDLIRLRFDDAYTLGEFVDGARGYDDALEAFPAVGLSMSNLDATWRQVGGELGVRTYPVEGLDIYANYSIHDTEPVSGNFDDVGPEIEDERTSQHKVNAGVQVRTKFGLDLLIDMHFASEQLWVMPDGEGGFEQIRVPPYVLLNARIGYRLFADRLELGVVGTNLLFDKHREHPWGQVVDTRVMGEVVFRFGTGS